MRVVRTSGASSVLMLFMFSLVLIVVGILFSVTLVGLIIGVPLILVGLLVLIFSILWFVLGGLGGVLRLLIPKRRVKKDKKSKIIDLTQKEGVYAKR